MNYLALFFKLILLVLLVNGLSSCGNSVDIGAKGKVEISTYEFEQAQGVEFPAPLYFPNSIVGWELSTRTAMTFDQKSGIYSYSDIPLQAPIVDEFGPRFKICSDKWARQFGFGGYEPDEETIFGVTRKGIVLSVSEIRGGSSDLHMEFSEADVQSQAYKHWRMEFKVTRMQPNPEGLMRISLY